MNWRGDILAEGQFCTQLRGRVTRENGQASGGAVHEEKGRKRSRWLPGIWLGDGTAERGNGLGVRCQIPEACRSPRRQLNTGAK